MGRWASVGWVGGPSRGTRTILYKILLYVSYSTTSTVQYKIKREGIYIDYK